MKRDEYDEIYGQEGRRREESRGKNVRKGGIGRKVVVIVIIMVVLYLGYEYFIRVYSPQRIASQVVDQVETFVEDEVIGHEGEVVTITESSIQDVLEISELQTADYIYNAITQVYDEDGETVKYYVSYEGLVTAGLDFSEIKITIDEEKKTILLQVPEVGILDTVVDGGTLEYIFTKAKYDKDVYKEAYEVCQKDLLEKVEAEEQLLSLAKSNAISVVEALVLPWVEQVDSEYSVVVE